MEIHAPHKPVLTVREAIVHLAIVTVGILIALSLDGVREWREHLALAAEARANLLSEIRENKAELDRVIATFTASQQDHKIAYEAARNLLASQPLGTDTIHIGFQLAELSSAAYTTSEITGAFGHMEYGDVRGFARVYDLQRKYDALQDQSVTNVSAASALLVLIGDPSQAAPREIEDWKGKLEQAIGALVVQRQLAEALSKQYGEFLAAASE
jgi:hypothetical protein